jgi:hypothetical protein
MFRETIDHADGLRALPARPLLPGAGIFIVAPVAGVLAPYLAFFWLPITTNATAR